MPDLINHPPHYGQHPSGVKCIEITEHMNFCLGNAVKYIWRADHKGNAVEDLRKAAWYIQREIDRRHAANPVETVDEDDGCWSRSPIGVACTRRKGHDGDHALNGGTQPGSRWTGAERTVNDGNPFADIRAAVTSGLVLTEADIRGNPVETVDEMSSHEYAHFSDDGQCWCNCASCSTELGHCICPGCSGSACGHEYRRPPVNRETAEGARP